MDKYYIGIDLGGTNIAAGLVSEDGRIVSKASTPTMNERDYKEIVKDMGKLCSDLIKDNNISEESIISVGIGSPGSINKKDGVIVYSNNLKFENTPMRAELEKYIKKPIYIDNDANCAAWAEVMAGSAKGISDAIMITLGTGVGGGIIVNSKLYSGFNFCGGELGHTVINTDGPVCTCGRRGCFEVYSSATGLIRMTAEKAEKEKNSLLWKYTNSENKFTGRTAFLAAAENDKAAKEVVEEYIKYLAVGVANMINIFQPQVFIIGGGLSNEGENLLAPLREAVFGQLYTRESIPATKIVKAVLGNDAGIIGAALLKE